MITVWNQTVFILITGMTIILAGCANPAAKKEPGFIDAEQHQFIPTNQRAASALLNKVKARLDPAQPLLIATLVDINVLEKSSPLGRILSEQVSAVFSNAGFHMIEMKFRNSVYMKRNEGELMLTREINEVAKQHNAQAVILGTYVTASDLVFINLKVVQPNTNIVLAAHDYALPLDSNIRALLTNILR